MIGPLVLAVVVAVGSSAPAGTDTAAAQEQGAATHEELESALVQVLASCENALGVGECTRSGEGDDSWHALVVFSDDGARVTLARPNRVIVRSLQFFPEDSEKQRRVAAGLLVAAMTAAARLSEPDAEAQARTEQDQVKGVRPTPETPEMNSIPDYQEQDKASRESVVSLELAAIMGPTLGRSHIGGGALAGALYNVHPRVGVGIVLEGIFSRKGEWEVMKFASGAGPRFLLFPDSNSLGWDLGVEGVIDLTQVNYMSGASASQGAIRGGGRLRTTWSVGRGGLRPFLGLGVTALAPVLEIQEDGSPERVVPAFLGSVFLGVRYKYRE
jgi:hypothetical protein